MTQDEIIKMVIQAEILAKGEEWVFDMSNAFELTANQKQLEAFAKLVAEQEREKILGVLRRKPDQQIYKVLDEIRSMN